MKGTLPDWISERAGLRHGSPFEVAFGDERAECRAALERTVRSPLVHLGLISAAGPDAAAFLQGQLSNDVMRATPARPQLASFNSPKGRMLAVLTLFRTEDAFLLEVHRSVLDAVLRRLRMFVLRSKVALSEPAGLAAIGIAGPDAANLLAARSLPAPDTPLACASAGDVTVTRRHGDIPRFTLHGPDASVAACWERFAGAAESVGTAAWRRLELEAGVPTVHPETQDRFVAQMCNLDQLGGLSFNKGCYTGQEVIARVHYRGSVKRRMRLVRLAQDPPAPGSKTDAGEVVDAAPDAGGGSVALVVGAA